MLPKQAISHKQLLAMGISPVQAKLMVANLKIYPTPFKGVYYVPSETERKAWVIERPMKVLSMALELYLGTRRFYFGGRTALEASGMSWQPSGIVHVVNSKRSGNVDLQERIGRNNGKKSYRAGKIARLLSFYGKKIVFHKVKNLEMKKAKETPLGRFASKAQAEKERKKFRI